MWRLAKFAGILGLLAAALTSPAKAANQPVYQSGLITRGHVPIWQTNGVQSDGGGAASGNITELGITGPGCPFEINDAPVSSLTGYHAFSLCANSLGGALISYQAYGGATPLPLQFDINGVLYPFPPSGGGGGGIPSVATDAALAATAITVSSVVVRQDYAVGNGAMPEFFYSHTGDCASNGRVDDGGWCRNATSGGSWLGNPTSNDSMDIKEFGAKSDNATDVGPFLQIAYNDLPTGICVWKGPGIWLWQTGVIIGGSTPCFRDAPHNENQGGNLTTATGAWNHISSTSVVPWTISATTPAGHGGFYGHAWYEDQPTPAPSWAPSNYQYIYNFTASSGGRIDIHDQYFYNVTHCVSSAGFARIDVARIQGQPLGTCFLLDNLKDVFQMNEGSYHFWDYWSSDINVAAYTFTQNVIQLGRIDAPMFGDIFCRKYRACVDETPTVNGSVGHAQWNTIVCDGCLTAIDINGTGGNPETNQISRIEFNGGNGVGCCTAGSSAIIDNSAGAGDLQIGQIFSLVSGGPIDNITNPTSTVRHLIGSVTNNEGWGQDGGTVPMFLINPLSSALIAVPSGMITLGTSGGLPIFIPAINANTGGFTAIYNVQFTQDCGSTAVTPIALGFGTTPTNTGMVQSSGYPHCAWSVDGKGGMKLKFEFSLTDAGSSTGNTKVFNLPYVCSSLTGVAGGGPITFATNLNNSITGALVLAPEQSNNYADVEEWTSNGVMGLPKAAFSAASLGTPSALYGQIDCQIR